MTADPARVSRWLITCTAGAIPDGQSYAAEDAAEDVLRLHSGGCPGEHVKVPVTADISDGYHTFGELYAHRRALTAALCRALPLDSWRSKAHHPDDDPMFEGGYFIVGIDLPEVGTITYHYKLSHWGDFSGVIELAHAPKWDGAAPAETVTRLLAWASTS